MMNKLKWCIMVFLLASRGLAIDVTNQNVRLDVMPEDGSVVIEMDGIQRRIFPTFTVMFSSVKPGYAKNWSNYPLAPRFSLRWSAYEQDLGELNSWLNDELGLSVTVAEDANGNRSWDYGSVVVSDTHAQGTTNPFLVGERTDLVLDQVTVGPDGVITWQFDPQPGFSLSATMTLPQPSGPPRISWQLTAEQDGYFSVAFTGAPGISLDELVTVPQMAAGRGFKQYCHLVSENFAKLPRVHLFNGGTNIVLAAESASVPFQDEMPSYENARFGTMIWRENDTLTPMIFAPVMGADNSQMSIGDQRSFASFLVLQSGEWKETHVSIARDMYRFRDMRDNSGSGPLNNAIYNIVDFLTNRNGGNYAMWHAEQKYYNYWSDKSGIFKPFSPLFGLAACIVLDDEDFYRERALPIVEFSLSRMSNVFSPYDVFDNGMISTRDRRLGSPYVSVSQLASLWSFYQERNDIFELYANQAGFDSSVSGHLAAYRFSADSAHLTAAVAKADSQLSASGTYFDFLDVYEATGESRFLDAARDRAYTEAAEVNLFPEVPHADITLDVDGVPIHAHAYGRNRIWGFPPADNLPASQQTVPAWRASEIGLMSETHHRAELWMHNHPQYLRIASYAEDSFLRELARWGAVGRYGNYAGDNRTQRSLVTEFPDAAEHPVWMQTYTSFNPGHAWEFLGALIDFLVTDTFDRSGGAIHFPAASMAGSHFRVNVYGDRPGQFYDETGVQLWMPEDLLSIDNPQIDYVSGYGNGKLYLAFVNQSFSNETVQVDLNTNRVDLTSMGSARTWVQNEETKLSGSLSSFSVPAKGIVAMAINGVQARRQLQAKMFDPDSLQLGSESYHFSEESFGMVHAMLLSIGRGLTSAFVYADALPENVITTRLKYRQGAEEWTTVEDAVFPFEYSLWLDEDKGDFEYELSIQNLSQTWLYSGINSLSF